MKISDKDYIKAVKRADREYELEQFGKMISTRPTKIHTSKKKYDRNKMKKFKYE